MQMPPQNQQVYSPTSQQLSSNRYPMISRASGIKSIPILSKYTKRSKIIISPMPSIRHERFRWKFDSQSCARYTHMQSYNNALSVVQPVGAPQRSNCAVTVLFGMASIRRCSRAKSTMRGRKWTKVYRPPMAKPNNINHLPSPQITRRRISWVGTPATQQKRIACLRSTK